jgi:hypothetical protein
MVLPRSRTHTYWTWRIVCALIAVEVHYANLTPIQVVGYGQSTMVDRSVPVVAKMDKCIVQHSRNPRAVLPCGTQSPIIGEVEVGVIVQRHLKH